VPHAVGVTHAWAGKLPRPLTAALNAHLVRVLLRLVVRAPLQEARG